MGYSGKNFDLQGAFFEAILTMELLDSNAASLSGDRLAESHHLKLSTAAQTRAVALSHRYSHD